MSTVAPSALPSPSVSRRPRSVDAALERELADFVATEAALLDAGRLDEWLALFADDGRYWVPLQGAAQVDPVGYNSLAYEDRLLLTLRVERLKNPRAHSQQPRSRCQHVLQRSVLVDAADRDSGAQRVADTVPLCRIAGRRAGFADRLYRHWLVDIHGAGRSG
jgi:hypothetical protein